MRAGLAAPAIAAGTGLSAASFARTAAGGFARRTAQAGTTATPQPARAIRYPFVEGRERGTYSIGRRYVNGIRRPQIEIRAAQDRGRGGDIGERDCFRTRRSRPPPIKPAKRIARGSLGERSGSELTGEH